MGSSRVFLSLLPFMMVFPFDCLYFGYAAAKWPSSSSAWNIHIKHSTDFPFVFASPNANNSIRASIIHHFLCLVVLHVESSGFYTALFFIHTHTHWSQMFDLRKKCKFAHSPFALSPQILHPSMELHNSPVYGI